jgi:hypothetical protein
MCRDCKKAAKTNQAQPRADEDMDAGSNDANDKDVCNVLWA